MTTLRMSSFGIIFLRLFAIFLLGGFLPMMIPGKVSACMCDYPRSPTEELKASSAVFTGEVVSRGYAERDDGYADDFVAEFNVSTVWKGSVGTTIQVATASDGAACGFYFQVGGQYLVYASNDYPPYDLSTSLCNRTRPLFEAADDLAELGEGQSPTSIPPSAIPTPEEPENRPIGCETGSGAADLSVIGLMLGLSWLGLRRRRVDE